MSSVSSLPTTHLGTHVRGASLLQPDLATTSSDFYTTPLGRQLSLYRSNVHCLLLHSGSSVEQGSNS
ncbi:hypothetical protein TNCV_4041711 [Trichonephila clavipes]|nr:hypothetical protein TNCV_4041711 [Trichonephila clavipes]